MKMSSKNMEIGVWTQHFLAENTVTPFFQETKTVNIKSPPVTMNFFLSEVVFDCLSWVMRHCYYNGLSSYSQKLVYCFMKIYCVLQSFAAKNNIKLMVLVWKAVNVNRVRIYIKNLLSSFACLFRKVAVLYINTKYFPYESCLVAFGASNI